jgi:hypothetical protein
VGVYPGGAWQGTAVLLTLQDTCRHEL